MTVFDEFGREDLDSSDPHELLNAYLDGEVSDQERAVVEQALEADAGLRAELEALNDTRSLVRDLPLLEMPPDLARQLASRSPFGPVARPRRRSRARALAVSAVASVAFWGAVATNGDANAVVPDLASVVGAHTTASLEEEHPAADPSVMFTAPGAFDGFELVYATRHGEVAHAMYTDGAREVSVFEQPGRIDWDKVPESGQRLEAPDGRRGWAGHYLGQNVMVVERRGMVYTLVASDDAPMSEMSEMSTSMPGDDDSWVDRVRRASRRTTDFFGFDL